jgi:prepilin-type N-terminal cleavage/methylation domain-containing protein
MLESRRLANYVRSKRVAVGGFTLVELLIVIAIIAILATLVVAGLGVANRQKDQTEAINTLSSIKTAIESYGFEEGVPPGCGGPLTDESNDFPKLWTALMADPPDGGRGAPYFTSPPKEKIVVVDEDAEGGFRPLSDDDELADPKVPKLVLDPWGNPYVYRCNLGQKKRQPFMKGKVYDLYSFGENGKDDTRDEVEGEENDDIHQGK